MPDEETYTEEQARYMCAIAAANGQCAELLNTLAAGGAITWGLEHGRPKLVAIPAGVFKQFMEGLD